MEESNQNQSQPLSPQDSPMKESPQENEVTVPPASSEPEPIQNSERQDSGMCEDKLIGDPVEARLTRLEEITELLYWTKSTTVSTPLSQERALTLDKIYKHKTL